MPFDRSLFSYLDDGIRVAVRVRPGASRAAVEGVAELADGSVVLKARVTAPPEAGKANKALVQLLAKTWRLPKRCIRVVAGARARRKTLMVSGDPAELGPRLEAWLEGLTGGRATTAQDREDRP